MLILTPFTSSTTTCVLIVGDVACGDPLKNERTQKPTANRTDTRACWVGASRSTPRPCPSSCCRSSRARTPSRLVCVCLVVCMDFDGRTPRKPKRMVVKSIFNGISSTIMDRCARRRRCAWPPPSTASSSPPAAVRRVILLYNYDPRSACVDTTSPSPRSHTSLFTPLPHQPRGLQASARRSRRRRSSSATCPRSPTSLRCVRAL